MEYCGNCGNRGEDAESNPGLDDLADKQIDKSDEKRDGGDFSGRTSDIPYQCLLENSEWSCSGDSVELGSRDKPGNVLPGSHIRREGYQQEHTGCNCRIENILSESAESHLGNSDGNQGADKDNRS